MAVVLVLVLALIVCVCVCVVCLKTSYCLCLFDYFCDIMRDLILLVCVCVSAPLWFALLLCTPVRVCVHLYACLCLALWLPLPGQYFYFQEVLPVLAAKHCIMQANAELHQSALAKQKKRFGEEIARLQVLWLLSVPALHFHLESFSSIFHLFHCFLFSPYVSAARSRVGENRGISIR